MKLASFDIFDTTLLRRCGKPENIFRLMAERLYPDDIMKQHDFVEWRKRRQSEIYKQSTVNPSTELRDRSQQSIVNETYGKAAASPALGSGEVMLDEIYDRLQITDYRLQIITPSALQARPPKTGGQYLSSELVELEKTIERENLMVNPVILEEIERRRAEGWTIAFISDMYLDSEFLGGVLKERGCMKEGDKLYVSCECGCRKDTGGLYDFVRQELNPTEWKHWGDNRNSDVKMARRKGVEATWVDTTYNASEGGSVLNGFQRAARIALGDNAFVAMAADFVAPAYIPYILWIVNRLQITDYRLQIEPPSALQARPPKTGGQYSVPELCRRVEGTSIQRKLYFLSRDSYVLMKGAEVLREYYPDVELHYLFLSRKALMLPYLADEVTPERLLSVMDKRTIYGKSVKELLSLLATSIEEQREIGVEFAYTKIHNRAEEADFLNKLFSGDYCAMLRQRAEEAKRLLLQYFEQEGVLSGEICEMVDVGWLGTSRLMVNKILESVGAPQVRFLYYGVRGDVFGEECGEYISYFQVGELTTVATALIENYFSASPYPTTVGYAKSSESVIPLFPDGEEFCESEITKANCDAVALLTKWLYEAELPEEKLRAWACRQMNDIVALSKKIDLSPFVMTSDFDATSFVRKMTLKELLCFVCLGANITAFDKASLCLSVGYRYMNILWRLHSWSGRFRRFLYLRFKHNR